MKVAFLMNEQGYKMYMHYTVNSFVIQRNDHLKLVNIPSSSKNKYNKIIATNFKKLPN